MPQLSSQLPSRGNPQLSSLWRMQVGQLERTTRQLEQQKARLEGEVRQIDVRKGEMDRQRAEHLRQLAAIARTRQVQEAALRDLKDKLLRLERGARR